MKLIFYNGFSISGHRSFCPLDVFVIVGESVESVQRVIVFIDLRCQLMIAELI